ncbi:CPBP family intramembrane glutamic endopeptidase [Lentilactobacillus hilgardii]|uniref:CPBP family intramembrane glutamic endopeptidase n=1 Tax=Lentilactobacillus hilgardii TaxID=1588 RepID=UPI0021A2C1CF|nr:type II CAAX endopeptidase family protein [Lentilactobacillus hilgardii]MCT3398647.1 CPBP family intramembrane metalloprotease [Lentilactobacillus hilgardii]
MQNTTGLIEKINSVISYVVAVAFYLLTVFIFTPIAMQKASLNNIGMIAAWAIIELLLITYLFWDYWRMGKNKLSFKTFSIKWVLLQYVLTFVVVLFLSVVHSALTKEATTVNNQNIVNTMSMSRAYAIMSGMSVVLFGPICEELIFRGLWLQLFSKNKPITYAFAILLSSTIFGLLHSNDSFSGNLIYIGLGLMLSFTYLKHENIYENIAVHMLNNGVALLLITLHF